MLTGKLLERSKVFKNIKTILNKMITTDSLIMFVCLDQLYNLSFEILALLVSTKLDFASAIFIDLFSLPVIC